MKKNSVEEIIILIAEDDDGHAELIVEHLREAGVHNKIIRFKDGEEILNFLFDKERIVDSNNNISFLILLDIRMPKIDGVQVLEKIKSESSMKEIPIIMLTTTDDPREIEKCYKLGCNSYITKPVDFNAFAETLRRLGLFILVIKVPEINLNI